MPWLGVADGVGGWNTFGINPALFAWDLMETSKSVVESDKTSWPWQIMEEAYASVQSRALPVAGSSTACIVTFGNSPFTGFL